MSSGLASGVEIKAVASNMKGMGREQQRFKGGNNMCKSSPVPHGNTGEKDVK